MKNKYRVAPVSQRTWNGRVYASKSEMRYAQELQDRFSFGGVAWWIEQPLFRLGCPENTYRPDFLVAHINGLIEAVDVKGVRTAAFKKNMKLWIAYAPIPLRVVTPKGKNWSDEWIYPISMKNRSSASETR